MKRIEIDVITNKQQVIEMTAEEVAQAEAQHTQWQEEQTQIEAAKQAEAEAKQSALAKLAALGLTQDEVKALIG
jgi:hypothetical protein